MQMRLVREARAMARLSHPNVVAAFDVGSVDDQVFVAMELVKGGTLRSGAGGAAARRRNPRSLSDGRPGLAAAHEAGLVHRDFKPYNVLVTEDGRVVVTDFGLARLASDAGADPPGANTLPGAAPEAQEPPLTETNTVLGTPACVGA